MRDRLVSTGTSLDRSNRACHEGLIHGTNGFAQVVEFANNRALQFYEAYDHSDHEDRTDQYNFR